jgi:hypothetical protein
MGGIFIRTEEPLGEPPVDLNKTARDAGLKDGEFAAFRLGQTSLLQRPT